MKRIGLILLVGLVLWFGLKNWTYKTLLSQGTPITAPAPDYELGASWAALPDQPLPAVWEAGWAMDVFYLPPPSGVAHKHGTVPIESRAAMRDTRRTVTALQPALQKVGTYYAPHYRFGAPTSGASQMTGEALQDRLAAFETYLETYNRGRAFFLVTHGPLDGSIAARIENDPLVLQRFGGVIYASADKDAALMPQMGVRCSEAFRPTDCQYPMLIKQSGSALGFLLPQLPIRKTRIQLEKDELGASLAGRSAHLLAWLEENGARSAEPLGDMESINSAPIREPGQTDEAIAEAAAEALQDE